MPARWGWLLVVLTVVCSCLEVVVLARAGVPLWSEATFRNAFPLVNLATVVGALVGAVILSRDPGHRIGWLFGWGQLGVALGLLLRAVADTTLSGRSGRPALVGRVADAAAVLLGSTFALMLLALWAFLAPDGRLPSRRWSPFLLGTVVAYGVAAVGAVLYFGRGLDPVVELVFGAGQLGVFAGLTAAVTSLVRRLARATGDARQQLRWIAAAAVVLAAAPIAAVGYTVLAGATPLWVVGLLHLGYLGIPVATGFAVLRYRLYDVDRLMAGSVILAVLAALAVAGYVLLAGLVAALAPEASMGPGLSLALFLVVVAAFQPVRAATRRLANRFVYGPQALSYDALRTYTRRLVVDPEGQAFLDSVAESAARLVSADSAVAVVSWADGTQDRGHWPTGGGRSAPAAAALVVPVRHAGTDVGRLELAVPAFAEGSGRRRALLETLADRVADRFALLRLEHELRTRTSELERLNDAVVASRARLIQARDVSRRQVAGRIRAEVVGQLVPLPARLTAVEDLAGSDPEAAQAEVDQALAATGTAVDRLRRITSTVYSRVLTEQGLAAAIRAEGGDRVILTAPGRLRWPAAVESALFACVLDAVRATTGVWQIRLDQVAGRAVVRLDPSAPAPATNWLAEVRERVEVLGGTVEERETGVSLTLPLPPVSADREPLPQ